MDTDQLLIPEEPIELVKPVPKQIIGKNRASSSKPMMLKKTFKPIGIDTDAINELYTYGGEQGEKKDKMENEMMDFE